MASQIHGAISQIREDLAAQSQVDSPRHFIHFLAGFPESRYSLGQVFNMWKAAVERRFVP
jgi:hypothetical protein